MNGQAKTAALALLIALPQMTYALSDSDKTTCENVSNLAVKIMESRQNGAAMADLMTIAKDDEILHSIIIAAYKQPRMNTESYQQVAIQDFRNQWYLKCAMALEKPTTPHK